MTRRSRPAAARAAVVVRPVRRGDEARWYACPAPWAQQQPAPRPFTMDAGYVAERRLVALRGERVVGRLWWNVDGLTAAVVDPVVVAGEDVEEVAGALLADGLRRARRRTEHVFVIVHEKVTYADRLVPLLERLGLPFSKRRLLHGREGAPPAAIDVAGIDLVAPARVSDPRLVETIARCDGGTVAAVLAETKELARSGGADWRLWEIALRDGAPVGVVLPGRFDRGGSVGTMYFVGVVPEARGNGLGELLTVRAIRSLAARGVPQMKDATDDGNAAMLAVFRRTGYRLLDAQRYYGWKPRGAF